MISEIKIRTPDDWHLHVRDGYILQTVVPHTAQQFNRALIMPNLNPPVTTVEQALSYRKEIIKQIPKGQNFSPYMTIFLTANTPLSEIRKAAANRYILGFKFYPAGATTNSSQGVQSLLKMIPFLEEMAKNDLVLQVHGEVVDSKVDVFDREAVFIEETLAPIHQAIPNLRIVFEHVSTKEGVDFVESASKNVAATITPQHLLYNRNAIFLGGLRPHYYCLPILKRIQHQQAIIKAAVGGNESFFLGTDSAPHDSDKKETSCGCAGIYSAFSALEIYTEIFEDHNALNKLENFASVHGANFYQLTLNDSYITLCKKQRKIPDKIVIEGANSKKIIPLKSGEVLTWAAYK